MRAIRARLHRSGMTRTKCAVSQSRRRCRATPERATRTVDRYFIRARAVVEIAALSSVSDCGSCGDSNVDVSAVAAVAARAALVALRSARASRSAWLRLLCQRMLCLVVLTKHVELDDRQRHIVVARCSIGRIGRGWQRLLDDGCRGGKVRHLRRGGVFIDRLIADDGIVASRSVCARREPIDALVHHDRCSDIEVHGVDRTGRHNVVEASRRGGVGIGHGHDSSSCEWKLSCRPRTRAAVDFRPRRCRRRDRPVDARRGIATSPRSP